MNNLSQQKPNCYILIGIPCSGKSTYVKKVPYDVNDPITILSCDSLRTDLFGKKYTFSQQNEKRVWDTFYDLIQLNSDRKKDIIIDNTNCKRLYINKIEAKLSSDYKVHYIWFPIPLWKAYLRNYIRYIFTGKWIPLQVMKNMHKNFKTLRNDMGYK